VPGRTAPPQQYAPPPPPPSGVAQLPQRLPQFLQDRLATATPLRPSGVPSRALVPVPAPVPEAADPFSSHDAQLGKIFTNMRAAMKVSRETIARRLATTGQVIEALETGTIANFPHHRETARIVRGYCDLLKLDPEPILWRIRSHYHASGLPMGLLAAAAAQSEQAPAQRPPATVTTQRTVRTRTEARRRKRRSGRLLVLSLPVVAGAALLLMAQAAPGPVYSALSFLPDQMQAPARRGFDALVVAIAPTRDGLRWIEVGDPQLRKGDKLQTSRR
jgi:hypothetical protein